MDLYPIIVNRPEALPVVNCESAIVWCCLRGPALTNRELAPPRRSSKERNSRNLEQIYYILAGEGTLVAEGQEAAIREGDAIHLLPETTYHISNKDEAWLTYLIVAAR